MDIDVSKMGNFGLVGGNSAEIYRQDAQGVKSGGTYHGKLGALFRSKKTEAANNEIRSQFLKALADQYGVEGYSVAADGRLRFEEGFVRNLSKKLGADITKALKLNKDFDIRDGYVTSGRPLTERRISAVNTMIRAQASGVRPSGGSPRALTELGLDILRATGSRAKSVDGMKNARDFALSVLNLAKGDLSKIDNDMIENALRGLHQEITKKASTGDDHWGIGLKNGVADVEGKRSLCLARIKEGVLRSLRALAAEGNAPAGMRDGMKSIREHQAERALRA